MAETESAPGLVGVQSVNTSFWIFDKEVGTFLTKVASYYVRMEEVFPLEEVRP